MSWSWLSGWARLVLPRVRVQPEPEWCPPGTLSGGRVSARWTPPWAEQRRELQRRAVSACFCSTPCRPQGSFTRSSLGPHKSVFQRRIPVVLVFVSCGCSDTLPQTQGLRAAQTHCVSVLGVRGLTGLKRHSVTGPSVFCRLQWGPFSCLSQPLGASAFLDLCPSAFKAHSGPQGLSQGAVFGLRLLPPSCPPHGCRAHPGHAVSIPVRGG